MNPLLLTVACFLACFSAAFSNVGNIKSSSSSSSSSSWSSGSSPKRTGSILDPCPQWNSWTESKTCVMPTELAGAVNSECPAHPSDHRRRSLFGVSLLFGFFGRGPSSGRQKPMSHLDASDEAGQQSWSRRRPTPAPKIATPWESIYTKCGSCGVRFRCKTRTPLYGCSPSLEVERAPCTEADGKAACQLGPQQCSQVDKNLWDNNAVSALKRSLRTRSSSSSNRFRSINEAAWTPITGFEDVFYGNNGNQKSRFRSLDSMPMPTLNCVKSWRGCTCCCKPFVPVDGVCRDATTAIVDLPKPPQFVPAVEETPTARPAPPFPTVVPLAPEFVEETAAGPSHSGSNNNQNSSAAESHTHTETEVPLAPPFPAVVPVAPDFMEQHNNKSSSEVQIETQPSSSRKRTANTVMSEKRNKMQSRRRSNTHI